MWGIRHYMLNVTKGEALTLKLCELQPGTIIVAKSSRAQPTRKVYKTKWHYHPYSKSYWAEVWSVIVRWDKKANAWEEECSMVSNALDRITHMIVQQEDGTFVKHPLKLVMHDPDD